MAIRHSKSTFRSVFLPVLVSICLAFSGGCAVERTLSWNCAHDGHARVSKARNVALSTDLSAAILTVHGNLQGEINDVLLNELMTRRYKVTVLPGIGMMDKKMMQAMMKGMAGQQDTVAPDAERETAQRDALKASDAELHMASSIEGRDKTTMHSTFLPIVHTMTMETKIEIRAVNLRLIAADDGSVLGTVSVRYNNPTTKAGLVARDVMLGVDKIVQGAAPGSIKLVGEAEPKK